MLSAAYSPEAPDAPGGRRQSAVLGPLFMMMGRALERIASVPAGNVLAIAGVSDSVPPLWSHVGMSLSSPNVLKCEHVLFKTITNS